MLRDNQVQNHWYRGIQFEHSEPTGLEIKKCNNFKLNEVHKIVSKNKFVLGCLSTSENADVDVGYGITSISSFQSEDFYLISVV